LFSFGAGSHVFSRHLITDILTYPELRESTISLMDISQENLDPVAAFAKNWCSSRAIAPKIESTTNTP